MNGSNTTAALITRTPSGTDDYGQVTYTETYTVLPGIFWPAGSSESTQGQDQVRWQNTLCVPTGTDVSAVDAVIPQVILDGQGEPVLDDDDHPQGDRFEVAGEPAAWPANPFSGWQPPFSVVLQLNRETG